MDEKKRKEFEALTADHERWDNRELGASEEHLQVLSEEQQTELDKDIDDGLGLQHISIRLNRTLIEQLKGLAKLEGLGYQPLVRQVLTKYAKDNEHKLDMLLSAAEAADRADKLFAQAVKLRDEIPKLAPLSNERIFAEGDYSKALGQAQILFAQAFDDCKDAVLKQHTRLRMSQIADLCQQELQADHDKKYGKKKQLA
jgi:predicted DNA binding CopG/RHH family protein